MDTNIEPNLCQLIQRLHIITSPRKSHMRSHKKNLYASLTVPGFDHIPARRDTLLRAGLLKLPKDMSGETVVELGSNCGSMAFLCAQRGASVTGYEYNQERVNLCNDIAAFSGLNARFMQMDFDRDLPILAGVHRVVALAFDVYLLDNSRTRLYESFGEVSAVHFESNMEWSVKRLIQELETLSGMTVHLLGIGDYFEGVGRTRLLLEQK